MSSTAATASTMARVGVEAKKRNSTAEIVAASMVGTAIEFYDNYCYSIAAASYFGLIFFTDVAKSDPVLATLLSFVTFAVSFLARPFGSLLFGHFGDKLGRKKTLVVALMLMGIATFVVGLLPGMRYWAPPRLFFCACAAHARAWAWAANGRALLWWQPKTPQRTSVRCMALSPTWARRSASSALTA